MMHARCDIRHGRRNTTHVCPKSPSTIVVMLIYETISAEKMLKLWNKLAVDQGFPKGLYIVRYSTDY